MNRQMEILGRLRAARFRPVDERNLEIAVKLTELMPVKTAMATTLAVQKAGIGRPAWQRTVILRRLCRREKKVLGLVFTVDDDLAGAEFVEVLTCYARDWHLRVGLNANGESTFTEFARLDFFDEQVLARTIDQSPDQGEKKG